MDSHPKLTSIFHKNLNNLAFKPFQPRALNKVSCINLSGLHKTFRGTTKKCENKNLS